jgi:hypothetical protein
MRATTAATPLPANRTQRHVATNIEIQRQHQEILTHADRLRRLLHGDARGLPNARARVLVLQHVRALAVVLQRHFAAEEEDGYMAEALRQRPDLAARAERIRCQHAALERAFESTLRNAQDASLAVLSAAVDDLLRQLGNHEAAERRLVEDAVLQDLGIGD